MTKIVSVFNWATNVLAFFAGILLVCLMLITTYLVGARYIFHKPPPWAIEVSEHMLAIYAFFAAAWLLKRGGHVNVDLVVRQFSPKKQVILSVICSILGAIICLVIFIFGIYSTHKYFIEDVYTRTVLNFPMWILIITIPIGFFFLSGQFIIDAYNKLLTLRERNEQSNSVEG